MVEPAREWRVKFDGTCARCGTLLRQGAIAVWDPRSRSMHCVECPSSMTSVPPDTPLETGIAGASAKREHDRRMAKREADATAKWGERFGAYVVRFGTPPQSTRAWAIGARGEEKLAAELSKVEGLHVLNDRKVPRTKGNIDHIVISQAGVFVVDAKNIRGRIHVRNRGWPWKPDYRLYVGGRDRSELASKLDWQVDAVGSALQSAGIDPMPSITPVLCFIDGDWPMHGADEFEGVRLESERSIRRLVTRTGELDASRIEEIARTIASALPAKVASSGPRID